ncbi:hypothetical protein A0H81_10387 [Grifola frondosa]|uniref:Uncharacterized protein n=1 Tax=Grifola frondosa TaxID=5627 RepID=A0A1C7LYA3_GRIFR|nr:hypothetical protein A0H81_10387 [Grifola frondosa]
MPQFHLWKVEDDSDYVLDRQGPDGDDDSFDELDIITHDPDERDEVDIVAYDPDKGGDEADIITYDPDEGEEEANESFINPDLSTSTIYTEAATNPMERIPDFAIIHLLAQSLPRRHPRFAELGGVHIIHQCCIVLVEVKPHPSRTANRRERLHNRDLFLSQAQEDLDVQCYVLFEQYPRALATVCIAAAGQYWTHHVEWVKLIRNVLEQKSALNLDGSHHGSTPAHLVLSWGVQRGTAVIPKSESPKRVQTSITLLKLEEETCGYSIRSIRRRSLLLYLNYTDDGLIFGWTYEQLGLPMEDRCLADSKTPNMS